VKHLPADSATVADFGRMWFALANVLAFRKTLCGGIGGRVFHAVRSNVLSTALTLNKVLVFPEIYMPIML
jgi:hypothetical protein